METLKVASGVVPLSGNIANVLPDFQDIGTGILYSEV